MEGLMGTGAVILGVLLRFGIPVLVTAGFVYFLRRLDERWQREGTQREAVRPDEIRIFSELRCWILNDCTAEQRQRCPAFIEAIRPCWQVHRNGNGSMKEDCLGCEIFKGARVPVQA
ncbi:MAG: hypothetical protein E4G99_10680 [Anaerolineales bacterium]|nr:MAG: hypothetical protein E4G99_10680 [Anaerolineales bacterium]